MISQHETNLVYRVLDANYNRAVEGLRAVEETVRFIIENKNISEQLKQLRHEVCSICVDWIDIWADQRDSQSDVGSSIAAKDEYHRANLRDIVGANLARANQSLRVLEEYSKAVCPKLPAKLESTRYQFYDVEKQVKRVLYVEKTLVKKNVYVLTSGCKTREEFESRVQELCKAGADVIQLREKNLDDGELLTRAKSAARICENTPTLFIVNDRPDIALMSKANGVHVGQEEFPISDVRKMLPHEMLIGVSTHSIEQAIQAENDGADYIGVGPTFPSHTKCFTEFKGTELLDQVAKTISIPAFAIGGINLENINQVAEAGFTRIAVSNAIHQADSVAAAIVSFRNALAEPLAGASSS